ncbi:aminotransferase class III-fold pyridoxal phosphate-dependent enzyme, partial [Acinetobacter nosocomialis]|uniref:aminotransferase class III-fold pyridoxal phosphate-dependent enzyme n=1 Tax=Acinetobacter nosocomialis TaxID=106654 RepID=UPI003AF41943
GRAEVMDAPNQGGLGGTYAGSPIAVAAAHAVIDAIEEENLCDRANELGAELGDTLKDIQQATRDVVTDIRALGSMVAVELETAEQAKVVQNSAMENGLLLLTSG